jgi:glucose-6-phosphate 1-dehydrogenase
MAQPKPKLPSTTLVIFGISGDLSHRYLLPALAEICQSSEVRAQLKILGLSRRQIPASQVLNDKTAGLKSQLETYQMDYEQPEQYQKLRQKLEHTDCDQIIFYFAVPPQAVSPIIAQLGKAGLNTSKYRLLMEKPFGKDLASAKKLIADTNRSFKEEQIYRIDHYLAKEMTQNIAVFLSSNALFRDIWNNQFIEKIDIVAEECLGIEGRAHFYEQTGALLDFQSHLLQLAALTIMDPCPDVFDVSMMRSRRLAALKNLSIEPGSLVKAQYKGYREEVKNPESKVETFVSFRLQSSDPSWRGVPITLTTGKRLKEKLTEIRVFFKKSQDAQTNLLRLRVQPKEGIEIDLWVKKPGYEQELQMLPLDFSYQQYFDRLPDAYEQVIVDAMRGRANLFASSDEIIAGWKILQPVLDDKNQKLVQYKPGSSVHEVISSSDII